MSYSYAYPRPALTVDCVIFGVDATGLQVLLIERLKPPFEQCWALPGGFFDLEDDSLRQAALRELKEETGLVGLALAELGAYSEKHRDPRERVVSLAFYGVVEPQQHPLRAGDDANHVRWFSLSELPPLAFDHDRIIADALKRLGDPAAALERFQALAQQRAAHG